MGKIQTIESGANVIITLNADKGTISAGGPAGTGPIQQVGAKGQDGELFLSDESGHPMVYLSVKPRHLLFRAVPASGQPFGPAMLMLDAQTPELRLYGAGGGTGDAHEATVHLRGSDGVIRAGGNGVDGRIIALDKNAKARIKIESSSGHIAVLGGDAKEKIKIDGDVGDIVLSNADCAEEFDIDEAEEVLPGSVMIIDENDSLRRCTSAYDKRVAGVLSGAGEYKPAMVLDRKNAPGRRIPIALIGKTCCLVDAQYAPIELGDLLTTSPTPGFAMKVTDPSRALGSVIGKALRPLGEGQGLVPILVALQ